MCIERLKNKENYADSTVLCEQQVTIGTKVVRRQKVIQLFRYMKLTKARAATERHFVRKLCKCRVPPSTVSGNRFFLKER